MSRIPPSKRLSQMAEKHFDRSDGVDLTGQLARLGARKLLQELLEGEVTGVLGREPYERLEGGKGYRNGYKVRRLLTAEGPLRVEVPQVRDTDEPFRSTVWPALRERTDVLNRLVVEMYARGLSTRDIEDALAEIGDGRPLLGRSTVSRLSETLWEEYEAFSQRDLSGYDVVYLFADAVYESLRQQAGLKEGILVTWAILGDGSKVLIHMSLGNRESYDDWLEHLRDLVRRGLGIPLTVTTDGAPGLIKAVEAVWPEAERIRCWAHKMRNVLDKVPVYEAGRRVARTSGRPTWLSAASRKSGAERRSSPGSAVRRSVSSSSSPPSGDPVSAGAVSASVNTNVFSLTGTERNVGSRRTTRVRRKGTPWHDPDLPSYRQNGT